MPRRVHVQEWLPIPHLLDHAAAFVTHGGFNSVKEAMSRGVPMVVIPLASDQYYSAERCAKLGLARVVPPNDRTPARVRQELQALLHDPSYAARPRGWPQTSPRCHRWRSRWQHSKHWSARRARAPSRRLLGSPWTSLDRRRSKVRGRSRRSRRCPESKRGAHGVVVQQRILREGVKCLGRERVVEFAAAGHTELAVGISQ